ncbi:hypothetical protein D8674_021309 [Pyrus ussuriensis x Pyrus communis]|uniref:Uncharacterized protein n=1 Tax=Pyrus ussuriensis x Pyrus communis TaxID=2448454 RepID=A0A5N5GLI8_9ROSA|nr:hypothetical protein D8674_021309 [Pyrus ussuriensis x Pyrus communis]
MSNLKKLEIPGSKSKHSRNRRLPPRRGQIKIRIFKELIKFLAPMAGGGARKPRENGGFLSSSSQTPAETPSGYCCNAQSDRS